MSTYDLISVGGGACGLIAALAATDRGAKALVLEKLTEPGGNSTLSTGSIPAAGTRFQAEAGIEDSPEALVRDILATSGPHEAEHLLNSLAQQSAELVHWLTDRHGVRIPLVTDYKHVGHTVPRLHAPHDRNGADLVNDLVAACVAAGVEIRCSTEVTELATAGNQVTGVHVQSASGQTETIEATSVLLASNGFGNNQEMLARWIPEMSSTSYFGADGSTGEAITWAQELGAGLANTGAYQAYASIATEMGDILSWTTVEFGAFIIDGQGKRFADESVGYSAFAAPVIQAGGESFTILDQRIFDYVSSHEPRFVKIVNLGCLQQAADVKELADFTGCDEQTLSHTFESATAAAAGTTKDTFGREDWGNGPLEAPYFVCRTQPGLFHTQGGVTVDEHARVLTSNGEIIRGLYAGGGVAAGVSGSSGAAGYASGNGLFTAAGLGYVAGKHIKVTEPAAV